MKIDVTTRDLELHPSFRPPRERRAVVDFLS